VQSSLPGEYGWEIRKITNLTSTTIDLDSPLSVAPGVATPVRRAWSGWLSARAAVLDVFRGLGPGDYAAVDGGPTRYPETTETAPDVLYVSSLVAAVVGFARGSSTLTGVQGVVDATVTTPAANVQEAPFELLIPQEIRFAPSN
jgi:hypothetical protein